MLKALCLAAGVGLLAAVASAAPTAAADRPSARAAVKKHAQAPHRARRHGRHTRAHRPRGRRDRYIYYPGLAERYQVIVPRRARRHARRNRFDRRIDAWPYDLDGRPYADWSIYEYGYLPPFYPDWRRPIWSHFLW